jgi:hypothetical protein
MEQGRARLLVDRVNANVETVHGDLIELWSGQGWLDLGYPSWAELCSAQGWPEVIGQLMARSSQRDLEMSMAEAGMSDRAISQATGLPRTTVQRDTEQVAQNGPPVLGLDGKTYTRSGIEVPEGDDPFDYESDCHVDPSGGVNDLRGVLRSTDRFLRNYYEFPSVSQLDVLDRWLTRQQHRINRARKDLP